jgi:hypothetical protein
VNLLRRCVVDVFILDFMSNQYKQKSWQKCTAKLWNLSGECLTRKTTHKALDEYLHSHSYLCDEIEACTGTMHSLNELSKSEAQPREEAKDDCDDSDILSSAVICDALGIEVSGVDVDGQVCVGSSKKMGRMEGLLLMMKMRMYGPGIIVKSGVRNS